MTAEIKTIQETYAKVRIIHKYTIPVTGIKDGIVYYELFRPVVQRKMPCEKDEAINSAAKCGGFLQELCKMCVLYSLRNLIGKAITWLWQVLSGDAMC